MSGERGGRGGDRGGRGGGDRKRKGGGGDGGRSRKHFMPSKGSNAQGGIKLGTRGVLVSCWSGKETQAGREAASLFQQAYEALRPQEAPAPAAPAADADISSLIAEEVAELKDTAKQPFFHTSTGLSSTVYVEFRDAAGPSPSEVVEHVCREAAATKQAKTRFCNRFYPIDRTVFAGLEKMAELGRALAAEHFPAGAAPIQFAIEFMHRAAPDLDRLKVIDAFVESIPTPPHKVNLTAPTKVIMVNLLKSTCGVAVVDSFRELQKYNIRALTEPPPEEGGEEAGKEEEGGSGAAAAEAAEGAPVAAEAGTEAAAQPAAETEPAAEEGGSAAAGDSGEPAAAATAAAP